MTNEEIKQLIALAQETGVAELEVQRGENRIRVKLAGSNDYFPVPTAVVAAPSVAAGPVPAPPASSDPLSDPNVVLVKSPIVGTFYESSSPGSAPFVKVGDSVSVGKVLCIIESMKLMNEIESEYSGTIVAKLVENGHPVEYGEAMFAVRPA
ncbi:MAG: acetyl-CoA carboxylase biotin carboxyl carrier protein [Acidobacteria bacterium]|nr:acetyl-CoA carboxylase biotin carboxyl carrier protein [Acidobacteriota bacterium]